MLITNYTTYNDVRALLGITEEEASDDVLSLQLYRDVLDADLYDIDDLGGVSTLFVSTQQVATPSADEERFLAAVRVFASYSVAKQLTASLPMFSPKEIEDGKARLQRFDNPYRDTIMKTNEGFEKWRNRLIAAFEKLGSSAAVSVTRPYFRAVAAGSDPITG